MWVERMWGPAVRALAKAFPAVLLTGPRQAGKTSLLRHLFPDASYVSLDDPAAARQAESNPEAFLAALPEPLIVDEVQYAPSLFRTLKGRIDAGKKRGRFLLTGSQSFPLMQGVSESLAGRCGVLPMHTLSFSEARGADPGIGDLAFLVRGGYPALTSGEFERAEDFYGSYVATYLERDVRNMRNVGDLRDFDRFLRAAALRSGQILSTAELARDVGVSPNTAKAWLSLLTASGVVMLLEPYHRSATKRLVKSPKLYFTDSGLCCHLVGIRDEATFTASPLAGALFETFVVGQVLRHVDANRSRSPLWFWRTSDGKEVDMLLERGGRFIALECKLAEAPRPDATRGFADLARDLGPRAIERALVVCRTTRVWDFDGPVRATALPVSALDASLP